MTSINKNFKFRDTSCEEINGKHFLNNKIFRVIATNFIFLCVVYFFFISNILTNTHDGLWHSDGYSLAVKFDIQTGRWLTPVFTILKKCFAVEPINTLISLMLVSVITFLILDIFNQLNVLGQIIGFIISLSATFTAQMAYSYMSQAFLIAEALATVSVWAFIKLNSKYKYIISVIFLVLALSFYQGALACYTIIVVFYLMYLFITSNDNIVSFKKALLSVIVCGTSCVLYYCVWTMVCYILNIEKSSYMGANDLNIIAMLKSIPNITKIVYESFYNFVFNGGVIKQYPFNDTFAFRVLIIVYLLVLLAIPIFNLKFKQQMKNVIIFGFLLVLSPLLCNPQKFLAVNSEILPQISIGYTLYFPLSVLFLIACIDNSVKSKIINIGKRIIYIFIILSFLSRGYQISIDFYTMYKTREASTNIMNLVVNRIINDGLYEKEYNYVFLGTPFNNALYRKAEIYNYANHQFVIGRFYGITEGGIGGYRGLLNYYMGLDFKFDHNIFKNVFERNKNGEFNELEDFPSENCYTIENDTVIFRIAK